MKSGLQPDGSYILDESAHRFTFEPFATPPPEQFGAEYDEAEHPRDDHGRWTKSEADRVKEPRFTELRRKGTAKPIEHAPPSPFVVISSSGPPMPGGDASPTFTDIAAVGKPSPRDAGVPAAVTGYEDSVWQAFDANRAPQRETAVWVTPDGVSHRREGDESSVSFSKSERGEMAGAVFTHFHPGGQAFSPEDVVVAAVHQLKELRAFGQTAEGTRYIYRMTAPRGWITPDAPSGTGVSGSHPFAVAVREADRATYGRFMARIRAGTLTTAHASAEHWHRVWTKVAPQFGLIYTRTRVRRSA
jgi:hypothetical protein